MSELKSKFVSIAQVAIVEFSINHPGKTSFAGETMEAVLNLEEGAIVRAYEAYNALSPAVTEFIRYRFTNGKSSDFKKPAWLEASND